MANGYQQSLLASMADLLTSNKYSDMMILSKTDGFNVHRAIVCPQSEGLASEIDTLLPDSAPIINCHEYDVETVGRMVDFLYTQDYDPLIIPRDAEFIKARFRANGLGQQGSSDEGEDDGRALTVTKDDLMAHILVHDIATDYDVHLLKTLAVEKFKTALEITPWNVEVCIGLIDHIYQQPAGQSSKLRTLIMDFASDHVAELENSRSYKNAVQKLETVKAFSDDLVPHARDEMARGALRGLFARLRQTQHDRPSEEESPSGDGETKEYNEKSATGSTEDQQDEIQDNAEGQNEGEEHQEHEEQAQEGDDVSQVKTPREQLLDATKEGREEQQKRDEEDRDEQNQSEEDQREEDEEDEDDDEEDEEDEDEEEEAQGRNEKSQSEDVESQESGEERQKGNEEHQKGDKEHQKGDKEHQKGDKENQKGSEKAQESEQGV
ncbi:hypothetical protein PRZ48_004173 [Zasmidium cellare]|uniref:BTB domain-containing protein n=1 Tax=Zasmidium cellare TaxID=395010 RepID=A0ABR0EYC8_ZASCE|nr:hypothetical protein PRZ48_004173 [Zasmidium cellare]